MIKKYFSTQNHGICGLKYNFMPFLFKKIIISILIGLLLLFGGLFLAVSSPILTIIFFLYYKPNQNNLKSFKKSIQEIADPDYRQKWRQEHDNLYKNEDDDELNLND